MALATDKQTLIESVFLARLIESKLYGEPKEGLAAELADKAPSTITPAGLTAAANAVIRKRNNGAFPALPACLSEIEAHSAETKPRAGVSYLEPVTPQTWEARATDFARRMGYEKGKIPVITVKANPDQWEAWRAYFRHIGMKASAGLMETAERFTVVAAWPQEFDGSYLPRATPARQTERTAA
jgi:hypothetical protein